MAIDNDVARARGLMEEYVASDSLRKHCKAVSIAMAAYAKKYGEDALLWEACGLLHDFDYEKFSDEHPFKAVEILRSLGYSEEILNAILGHALYSGFERKSHMAKCLFAVDELCGFIVACALVRPEHLNGLTPKSVKKRLKVKSFAAKVNRDEISQGIAELGVPDDEHIGFVISALQGADKELEL